MGVLSYLKVKKGDVKSVELSPVDASPIINDVSTFSSPPRTGRTSISEVEAIAYQDFKYDLMLDYLHQQQQQLRWTSNSADEGVIMKKTRDTYICAPASLVDVEDGFVDHIRALNVRVAMTINTPVISRFAARSVVTLANGQHIQVLPDITWLSRCQKYQAAAFISDRGQLVVWDDEPTAIVQRVQNLERELLNMIWRNDVDVVIEEEKKEAFTVNLSEVASTEDVTSIEGTTPEAIVTTEPGAAEAAAPKRPKVKLLQPFGIGLALTLVVAAMGNGFSKLLVEAAWDHQYARFGLIIVLPFLAWFSLFFFQAFSSSIYQLLGPIRQVNENSRFYAGARPKRLNRRNDLPHITIQMPVYKEGLEGVIMPTIRSIKAAISTYEMQGGTANIFVNDDGLQLITPELAQARLDFYEENNIGWVARPKHNPNPAEGEEEFHRRGKFKKASNMNYAMWVSTRVEDKLETFGEQWGEEEAYSQALMEVVAEDEGRTWAAGNIRIGDYILIIDSDTRVPRDCLLDDVSEMEHNPQCAVLQHASGVMNVTDSYFEKGITFFTNLVYSQIRYAVAAGDCAPFVGHNAILRWNALQYVSYICPQDNREKWWSEDAVSEDFDMSLRLQGAGYLIRLAAYPSPDGELYEEGVSLTVYDELMRWEKYAYGCSELMMNPFKLWFKKGPFTSIFITFLRSDMPLCSKFTLMAYIGTYYAIAVAWPGTVLNYFLCGWYQPRLDKFYFKSFDLFVAIVVVFTLLGNVTLAVMRFRGENRSLLGSLFENLKWIPLMTIFMGGISMHVSQAILSHLFSIDMSWGATAKELENSSFFKEIAKVGKGFKYTLIANITLVLGMIVLALAPLGTWKIDSFTAIWPLATVVFSHITLPILLNPGLMLFTW